MLSRRLMMCAAARGARAARLTLANPMARIACSASVSSTSTTKAARALSLSSVRSTAARTSASGAARSAVLCRRTLFIQTKVTPNPNSMMFSPGREVLPAARGTVEFLTVAQAQRSPLALRLFRIEGVQSCLLANEFIAVNITEGTQWSLVQPDVFAAITEFFESGDAPLREAGEGGDAAAAVHADTAILETDDEVTVLIKELIETRIRPAVQEDGGDIVFRGFRDGVVSLQLQGSCVGCPSSAVTLKSGIENMLKHYVPEVESVEEWVDTELAAVSDEALRSLEEKLAKAKSGSGESAAQ